MPGCLADDLVLEFVQGQLAGEPLRHVEHHLTSCADCRTIVAETSALASSSPPDLESGFPSLTTRREGHLAWSRAARIAPLPPGTQVGRYQIRELIGAGGIGFVYAAHDPELHRSVALKVLRSSAMPLGPAGDQRARLLREARAMAQLSHPNVVTVYDAGTYQDRVFLAMELVDGTTLRHWLESEARGLEEILAVFRAAGEGLLAAHRIGLVHRDFKPENVLVGKDGRVRVTDFGLARPANDEGTGQHRALGAARSWIATVTGTGILGGTPAYMAPEQFAGEAADPRSDQFGFSVALYEAVAGRRPYDGDSVEEIADAIVGGRLRPLRAAVPLPPRVKSAIERGLSLRRDDRFATMESLLAELAMGPAARVSRRRRVGRIAVAGLAASGVAIAVLWLQWAPSSRGDVASGARKEIPASLPPARSVAADPRPLASSAATSPQPVERAAMAPPPETPKAASAERVQPGSPPRARATGRSPRAKRARRRAPDSAAPAVPPPVRVGDGLKPFAPGRAGAP